MARTWKEASGVDRDGITVRRCVPYAAAGDHGGAVTVEFLDHDGLLTLARKAYAAAGDEDAPRLIDNLRAFLHALVRHLECELPALVRLPPAEARLVRRGQARVSSAARALLRDAAGGCAGPEHRCAARVEELLALLAIQALDERLVFSHWAVR